MRTTPAHVDHLQEAMDDYEKAIMAGNDALAYHNRGLVLSQQGKWDEALHDFTAGLDQHPNYTQLYVARGRLFFSIRKYTQSIADSKQALLLDPNNEMALQNLAAAADKCNSANRKLFEAIQKDDIEAVEEALAGGADIDARQQEGTTFLIIAIAKDRYEIARLLIDSGADVNASTEQGFTALMMAALRDHVDTAKHLLDRGADASAEDEDGTTAGVHAMRLNNNQVLMAILEAMGNTRLRPG